MVTKNVHCDLHSLTVLAASQSRRQEHERNLATAMRGLKTAAVLATQTLQLLWSFAQKDNLGELFLRYRVRLFCTYCG